MATSRTAPVSRSSGWGAEDRFAVQLRLSHLLNTTDFEPSGLPPSATLIVRRFRDPLPRRLCSDLYAVRAAADWEHAAQSALGEAVRCAARPARGPVPPTASAVMFASPAEFLACFARDLSSGQAAFRWWWRALPRGIRTTPAEEIVTALRREPRHIPAVLAQLDAWGALKNVATLFTPSLAQALLKAMLVVHGLPALVAAISSQPREALAMAEEESDSTRAQAMGGALPFVLHRLPWEPIVDSSYTPTSLGLEHSALVGIGLLLQRAPNRAHSAQFERALRVWARGFSLIHSHALTPEVAPATDQHAASSGPLAVPSETAPYPLSLEASDESSTPRTAEPPVARRSAVIPASTARAEADQGTPEANSIRDFEKERPALQLTELSFASGLATQLGGVLFLIPFLRALGLPDTLETEFEIEQPPGGWALLELIAENLLDRSYPRLARDPLWSALRILDGRREFEPPAVDFVGLPIYRLPAAWGSVVPTQVASGVILRLGEQRLIIRHALGFPLVDWHSAAPIGRREIAAELATLGSDGVILDHHGRRSARRTTSRMTRRIPDVCGSNQDLRRFLHFILPYIRWRLFDALAQSSMPPKTAAVTLLCRRGQLYVTSTHVDLVMDLKHVSLPVRLAGLDANPGWVPELGRVVTFHYR